MFCKYPLLLFLAFSGLLGFTQSTEDSVLKKLETKSYKNNLEHFSLAIEANTFYRFKDKDSALLFLSQADSIARIEQNDSLFAEFYFNKGVIQAITYQYDSAIILYEKALPYYKSTRNLRRLGYSYRNLGVAARGKGKYLESTKYLYEALGIYLDLKDSLMVNLIYFDLGSVAYANNEFEQAYEFFIKCKPFFEDDPQQRRTLAIISNALGLLEEHKTGGNGLPFFMESIELYGYIADSLSLAQVYNNIGMHYLNSNRHNADSALKYLQKSKRIFDQSDVQYSKSATYVNIGNALEIRGDYDEAVTYIKQGVDFAMQARETQHHVSGLILLKGIYKKQGKLKEALVYADSLRKVENEFNNSERKSRLDELKEQFNAQRKEIENARLKKQQANQNKVIEKQELINLLLVILVGTVIIFTIVIYVWYIRIRIANKNLIQLKKELEQKGKNLELLNESKSQLLRIIGHDLRSPVGNTLTLLKLIEDDIIHKKEEYLMATQSATNSLNLLNNLMEWINQVDKSVTAESDLQVISLKHRFEHTAQIFQVFSELKSISLSIKLVDDIEVWGDADILDTVIRNLLSNAYKFTPKGGSITLEAFKEDSEHARILIKDSGVGMDSKTIQSIQKGKSIQSKKGTNSEHGAGIGLGIVQSSLRKLNSKLEISSEKGNGSTFSFVLKIGK